MLRLVARQLLNFSLLLHCYVVDMFEMVPRALVSIPVSILGFYSVPMQLSVRVLLDGCWALPCSC